jgi:hypothetical protein
VKQYAVTLPVAGSITVFVDAENEEAALDAALEKQDWRVVGGEGTEPGDDFEAMSRIVGGNVCYAPCTEYSVEECE